MELKFLFANIEEKIFNLYGSVPNEIQWNGLHAKSRRFA